MKNVKWMMCTAVVVTSLVLVSCKKETERDPEVQTGKQNTNFAKASDFLKSSAPANQNFTLDNAAGGTITTTEGYKFTFPANALVLPGGGPVNDQVNISVQVINSKSDMVFSNITTVSGTQLLISDGMFRISAIYDGQDLGLAAGKQVEARIPGSNGTDAAMQLFSGAAGTTENPVNWVLTQNKWRTDTMGGREYTFFLDSLKWCNLDKFYNAGGTAGALSIKVPAEYGNVNTTVMLIGEERTAFRLYGDPVTEDFNPSGYTVYVGMKFKVLAVTVKDKILKYSMEDVTIGANTVVNITSFTEITEAALNNKIIGLD